jgi:heme/copper-type cytochrome/quinol oxidase subunit 2
MGHYAICMVLLFTCYVAPRQFHSTTEYTYKVHHNSFIEIVWTTIQHYFFVLAVPSFTLLYSLDEIVDPAVTVKNWSSMVLGL